MKALLIYPPISTNLPAEGSFPLGLGYIASALISAGHEVEVYDLNIKWRPRSVVSRELEQMCGEYDLIGVSGMVTVFGYIKWLIGTIKRVAPEVPVITGGTVASSMPDFFMKNTQSDMLCLGEGEETIKELANALEDKESIDRIPGLLIRKKDGLLRTPDRELRYDLDSIPFPAWERFRIQEYLKHDYLVPTPSKSMNIIVGRGCPYSCTFCYRNFGHNTRLRSVDNAIAELETLIDRYGVRHFEFQDELFTLKESYVMEFCQKVIDRKLNITWRCLGRANLAKYEMFNKMKEAGCHWIGFGIESGSPAILEKMRKKITPAQAKTAIELARKADIHATGTFIIGMPGETRRTIKETVEFCKSAQIYNKPFFVVPYPGTAIFDELKDSGVINDGKEEEMILKMGKDATNLQFNLTDMPDAELVEAKAQAEREIESVLKKSKIHLLIQTLKSGCRIWGFRGAVGIFRKLLVRYVRSALRAARFEKGEMDCHS